MYRIAIASFLVFVVKCFGIYVYNSKLPELIIPAPLAGATVYALLDKDYATVAAVYKGTWGDLDGESICFPIVAEESSSALACLLDAKPTVRLGDMELTAIGPVELPTVKVVVPNFAKVYWFQAALTAEQLAQVRTRDTSSISIEYHQRFIHDHFYYIPSTVEDQKTKSFDSTWAFQLIVRSRSAIIHAPAKPCLYDRLSDLLIVYLEEKNLVDIGIR